MYCFGWNYKKLLESPEAIGISFHPTIQDRKCFLGKLIQSDNDKKERGFPEYQYRPSAMMEVTPTKDFYEFVRAESRLREAKGVFATIPTLIHMLKDGFLKDGQKDIQEFINRSPRVFRKATVPQEYIASSIIEDTTSWYADFNEFE